MASNQSKRRRHRRSFGAIRQLASGNYQASYKALDGSTQVAPQTFKTREAADKYLAIKQAEQIAEKQASAAGRWILNKDRGAIALSDYISRHFATMSVALVRSIPLKGQGMRKFFNPVGWLLVSTLFWGQS